MQIDQTVYEKQMELFYRDTFLSEEVKNQLLAEIDARTLEKVYGGIDAAGMKEAREIVKSFFTKKRKEYS